MANNRRRRQSFGNNKPKPVVSISAMCVCVSSLIILAIILGVSASKAGDTPNLIGAIAVLVFAFAVAATVMAGKQLKSQEDFLFRIISFCVCLLSDFAWLAVYIIGMIH